MSEITIYTGGLIRTMSDAVPTAEAMAVSGNRFGAVGSLAEVKAWAGPKVRVIDLDEGAICPGFIETHNHLSDQAISLLQVDCTPESNQSIDRILVRLEEKASQTPADQWIVGYGYNDSHIGDARHLHRRDLDAAAPHHPVFVQHVTGHMAYCNSKALALSGLSGDALGQIEGGEIGRDANGEPNGLLIEPAAMNLAAIHIPSHADNELETPLAQTIEYFNRHGITSAHDAGLGWSSNPAFILKAYQNLESAGRLHLRLYLSIMAAYYRPLKDLGLLTGFGSDRLRLGSVKLFQDGSIQIHTAALRRPYHDRPETRGEVIHKQGVLDQVVEEFHSAGCQLAIHCNGDAAIDSTLEALEKAQKHHFRPDPRHLLIHCQMADETHIERMKAAGAMPSYFVNHIYYWGDNHRDRFLGPKRAAGISPLAETLGYGLPFTLHSDLPVTPVSPLFAMHCAVNRTTRSDETLGPDQKIDPLTALKAYTTWAACASFEESIKGSIEPGKLADFVILSADLLSVPPDGLKDIEVLATHLGGQRVWGEL